MRRGQRGLGTNNGWCKACVQAAGGCGNDVSPSSVFPFSVSRNAEERSTANAKRR